jgi:hypothetical protein
MHIGRLALVAVLAAALAPALSGCSDGPPPLSAPPPGGQTFCDIKPHHGLTYGLEDFTNHSSQTVVFDRVGVRDPQHLKVLGADLTPGARYLVGMWPDWPPKPVRGQTDPHLPPSWKHHRPVAGYRLRPGATAGVVLGIESTSASGGKTPGMLIWYHTASGSYVLRDDLAIDIDIPGDCRK